MGVDVEERALASRPRTLQISDVLTRGGLLLGVAYLVALAAQSSQLVASVYRDADAASAPVIGELFGASPHSHVLLGQMAWFSTLIFELATRSLPLHRQIWEVAPYAMALASAALVAWGSWRVAGRWAAAISGTLMICAAPHALHLLGRDAIAESAKLPSYRLANEVEQIARNDHLTVGYAGYWDAAPITWASHMSVKVYPVEDCQVGLCRFDLHQISSWYRPRAGASSFLLADPSQPIEASPPADLGAPSAVLHVGPATMYVYPYDIASHIHP